MDRKTLNPLPLAVTDAVADDPAAARGGVAVAGKVDLRGAAAAELVEEGQVHVGVPPSGAGLRQGPLVAVLAPVDGYAASVGSLEGS